MQLARILRSQRAIGFAMLGGTLVLWVGSSCVVQAIFGEGAEFEKPAFVTLFNSAMSVLLLAPRVSRCELDHDNAVELVTAARLSATVGLLWLGSQWVFNLSLLHTSVATNTVLSSTSSAFTFIFSLLICGDPFRWRSFSAAGASSLGCLLVAMQTPRNLVDGAVSNSMLGDLLALASAAMFALVSVLLRRLSPGELDLSCFMGLNGLLAVCLSPLVLFVADRTGLEAFRVPDWDTWMALAVNALLGCTLANYLYTSALLLLSPLVATIGLSLSIPLSAVTDQVVLKQHQFSIGWVFGAALVALGVVLAALDLQPEEGQQNRKSEKAEASELRSLLEQGVGGDEEDQEDRGMEMSVRGSQMVGRRSAGLDTHPGEDL